MQQLKVVDFKTAIGTFEHTELGVGIWVSDWNTYMLFAKPYNLSLEPITAKYQSKILFYLWPARGGLQQAKIGGVA